VIGDPQHPARLRDRWISGSFPPPFVLGRTVSPALAGLPEAEQLRPILRKADDFGIQHASHKSWIRQRKPVRGSACFQ